jgi:hypothetical protein
MRTSGFAMFVIFDGFHIMVDVYFLFEIIKKIIQLVSNISNIVSNFDKVPFAKIMFIRQSIDTWQPLNRLPLYRW